MAGGYKYLFGAFRTPPLLNGPVALCAWTILSRSWRTVIGQSGSRRDTGLQDVLFYHKEDMYGVVTDVDSVETHVEYLPRVTTPLYTAHWHYTKHAHNTYMCTLYTHSSVGVVRWALIRGCKHVCKFGAGAVHRAWGE